MSESYVWIDPERMGGTPCFRGTRVPVKSLFDYLHGGHGLNEFLDDFPSVKREQAMEAIKFSGLQFAESIKQDHSKTPVAKREDRRP